MSLGGLYSAYVAAIARYEVALRADPELQAKFSAVFPAYGIGVFAFVAERVKP